MISIIIEDEKTSANHLHKLITDNFKEFEVVAKLHSVEESIEWLEKNDAPELIFIDIELSDGTCFEVLDKTGNQSKLIFTTAYDQHAIKAFQYNSIAYLLKPISLKKLSEAIEKLNTIYKESVNDLNLIGELKKHFIKDFKKRFMIKQGEKIFHIKTEEIAYFVSEDGFTRSYLFNGKKHFVNHTIEELTQLLNPIDFFQINRKTIVNLESIHEVKAYFNRRLIVDLQPGYIEDVLISKERVKAFKLWLDN